MTVGRKIIIALTAAIFSGCVANPGPQAEPKSALFGNALECPIRVGETTRDAITARFGAPTYATAHSMACGYYFTRKIGTSTGLHAGSCSIYYGTIDTYESDDVWLEFDRRGVLKRCQKHLIASCGGDSEKAWRRFASSVPDAVASH